MVLSLIFYYHISAQAMLNPPTHHYHYNIIFNTPNIFVFQDYNNIYLEA